VRPRVLVVASDLPWPLESGGKIASYRMIEGIARHHAVDLVSLADIDGPAETGALADLCESIEVVRVPFTFRRHRARQLAIAARAALTPTPYRLAKFRSAAAEAAVARARRTRRPDLVHFEQLGVAPYRRPGLPATLCHHNIETNLYRLGARRAGDPVRRGWAALEAAKLARVEPRSCARFDHVFALTEADRGWLGRRGIGPSSVVSLGGAIEPLAAPTPPPPRPTLLTLGTMSWFGVEEGILWLAREIWPEVRRLVPAATWDLAGAHGGPAVRALDGRDGIHVRGRLEDVGAAFASARVVAVPLAIAGGMRLKIVDALSAGRPVVATALGAAGFESGGGQGVLAADDPAGFAGHVASLMTDDALWRSTAKRGLDHVRAVHAPDLTAAHIADVFGRLIGPNR